MTGHGNADPIPARNARPSKAERRASKVARKAAARASKQTRRGG